MRHNAGASPATERTAAPRGGPAARQHNAGASPATGPADAPRTHEAAALRLGAPVPQGPRAHVLPGRPGLRLLLPVFLGGSLPCSRVRLLVDDQVDGLLPVGDAENVRDHLDLCADCRQIAEAARAASMSLAAWGDVEPPPSCFDGILAKIRALPPEALARPALVSAAGRRREALRRWAGPSMAAAAAVIAAVIVLRHSAPQERRLIAPGVGPISAAVFGPATLGSRARVSAAYSQEDLMYFDGVRRVDPLRGRGSPAPVPAGPPAAPR